MSVMKPDPVVAAWDRLKAALRAHNRACEAIDEAVAAAAPIRPNRLGAAERRARREWRAAMQGMADTRATTTHGVVLKLKMIEVELRDGASDFGRSILASAIADLSRMGRKSTPRFERK